MYVHTVHMYWFAKLAKLPSEWFIVDGWNTYGEMMVSGDLQSVFVPVVTPSAQTMWFKWITNMASDVNHLFERPK